MMSIELINGENLILVHGMPSAMATDGYYIPAWQYAEENGLSETNIRALKRRKRVEAITLFGRSYVKKECKPDTRKYQKMSQKTCKNANPEECHG